MSEGSTHRHGSIRNTNRSLTLNLNLQMYEKKIIQQIWLPTLLVLSCLCTPFTSVYAQNIRVTIQLKDVRMKLVMTEIEKQTRYLFAIDDDVDVTRSVSVNVVNQPLQEALIQMVKGSDVSYQISGSNIVLKKKPIQKPVTVSGTVLDQNKQPVVGAFYHLD